MLDLEGVPSVLGVQFLSRVFEPRPLQGLRFREMKFSSGEVLDLAVDLEIVCAPSPFTFAQPWPQFPSIGAFEFVDPYANTRWPSRLMLTSGENHNVSLRLPVAFSRELLAGIRLVLATAIRVNDALLESSDQVVQCVGYRRIYHSSMLDAAGNPMPADQWFLFPAEIGEAIGPGFAKMNALADDGTQQSLVWSQAISFPSRHSIQVDKIAVRQRIQEVKQHWNSHQEIADARYHVDRGDEKAAVRAAAAAVEAAVRFYCSIWNVDFPRDHSTFDEKIEKILTFAGKPSYKAANQDSADSLLKLYRARNSMHEGDCYYIDPHSSERVEVRVYEARQLVDEAQRFLLWLDSQA
jgi:hypothetical protein